MAENSKISQIKLPNGSTYDIKDNTSGYTSNTGTITQVKTTAGAHTVIDVSSGAAQFNVPTKTSHLTNDSGFLTSYTETDPTFVASAAHGITSTDITNWNAKSDTDEKVKQIPLESSDTSSYGFILSTGYGSTEQTEIVNSTSYLRYKRSPSELVIYASNGSKSASWNYYSLRLSNAGSYSGTITCPRLDTESRTWTLPNATGTVALTSDIPIIPTNISAFTNDSGYLTSYTETDPTVPSWAKQSSKPTYTFSEIGSTPTTLSGYGITNAYTKTEIDGLVAGVLHYKGIKASVANLPTTGNTTGDVWHITADGSEYAWDGSIWQELGTAIDLSGYVSITGSIMSPSRYTSNQYMRDIFLGESMDGSQDSSGVEINPDKIRFRVRNFSTSASGDIYFTPQMALSNTPILKLEGKYTSSSSVSSNDVIIRGVNTPTNNTDAANKKYVDDSIGALSIPTKTSDLTNDSGFLTTDSDEKVKQTPLNGTNSVKYLIGGSGSSQTSGVSVASNIYMNDANPSLTIGLSSGTQRLSLLNVGINFNYNEGNKQGHLRSAAITANREWTLPDKAGTIALTSDIPTVPTKVSDLTNDSGFISSYTETDPVFSASAAAGITSTDISNWNAKVSDDKTWNGVILDKVGITNSGVNYVPARSAIDATTAYQLKATYTPEALKIAKWDNGPYLHSTTPSANDNSTKVATTAYVDAAIPKVYSSTNTGGYLTMATLPIYDGAVV